MAKQGKRSLSELAMEVEAQAHDRVDLVASTGNVVMVPHQDQSGERRMSLEIKDHAEGFYEEVPAITPHAHGQIATKLGIPKVYYDRLHSDHPELLVENVNQLMVKEPEKRLFRLNKTSERSPRLRAFLSDRYRRIDNYELMYHAVLPALLEDPRLKNEIEVISCEVTENKLYIKCISHTMTAELRGESDKANAGFVIMNSEIGLGAVSIQQYIYRQVCKNGLMAEKLFRKNHVGRNVDVSLENFMSDSTLRADDKAIMMKASDMIKASLDQDLFSRTLQKMQITSDIEVENPRATIERLGNTFRISEVAQSSILERFFKNEDRDGRTMFNIVNSITNTAEDVEDYDYATEREELGFKVMNLGAPTLRQMAIAG